MSGTWRLPDTQGWVELGPCPEAQHRLCGILVGFDGDHAARDFIHPDFRSWGELACGSEIVLSAEHYPMADVWRGQVYQRSEGRIVDAELKLTSPRTLDVLLYEGANLDEGVSLAIFAALGSPPDLIDLGDYGLRVIMGRELFGQSQIWRQSALPDTMACPP
ncbi:DUF2147 domain-containing protein [Oceanicaulis sp. MMSF_3324]|uniref:DUF2147 domain-containing protein n=1 Tax=Oceanicaulis sp. MMSF_3324 TaxID=3046702 RepID=UPI00273ED8EF|nr:DUF2147 domain-containing protein [Oceanicaulis sp. MMSF_3324]